MGIEEKVIDQSWATVQKVEAVSKHTTRIDVQAKYGQYSVDSPRHMAMGVRKGDLLEAAFVLVPSGLSDFIGQKPGPGDVVTASYELAYLRIPGTLYDECQYLYRRKKRDG
ncbi:hypothetical protein JXB28_05395 [Candidatus Woesearchaeota archaeon]|nr:hypothetical protein [Candidatus Woesearchaeota archaeon]